MVARKKDAPRLGTLIDDLYALRQRRLELESQVETLKAKEAEFRGAVLQAMAAADVESARGSLATATARHLRVPVVEDWDKCWGWLRKDPLGVYVQKRLATTAVVEYVSENPRKEIPGLGWVDKTDLSLTKAAAR